VDLVGYPATEKAKDSGKPLWASEEYSSQGGRWDPQGALYVARLINKVYIRDRITKIEFWSPFDGIYKTLPWDDEGFLQADQPWSGNYEIWPALWAVAHTTQFTEPGWRYLDSSSGRFSDSTWNGSYVTLRSESGKDWSMIVTTGKAIEMKVEIAGGLNSGPIHVWRSNERDQFIEQSSIKPKNTMFTIALDSNSIYTLTTTTGQNKGKHPVPPAKPFPFPYKEDFESYSIGSTPKYFSDQKGTFEVVAIPNHGKCLSQIVTIPGFTWFTSIPKPYSVFGNSEWSDYTISSDVFIEASDVEIGGRFDCDLSKLSYRFVLEKSGNWSLFYQDKSLAYGSINSFDASLWHIMSLSFLANSISATIDGRPLAKVIDNSAKSGLAYIVSSYYPNMFDNVTINASDSH
jgi:galactosylceramidase